MQLMLGTAEFSPQGYLGYYPGLKEIRRILSLAREAGITLLDTAESYGCADIIQREAKGFCIYTKTRDWKVQLDWGYNELRGILYHYTEDERRVKMPFIHRWVNIGSSVYTKEQLPKNTKQIIQIPFNIDNDQFSDCLLNRRTVFVRSVFNRGEALKKHSIKECLQFVRDWQPDGIIIGVKSVKELTQILKSWEDTHG